MIFSINKLHGYSKTFRRQWSIIRSYVDISINHTRWLKLLHATANRLQQATQASVSLLPLDGLSGPFGDQQGKKTIMGCYKRCHFRHWAWRVSDIHGLKHVAGDGGVLRRLIWTVATLAALTLFLKHVTVAMIAYFEMHHIVRVDIHYTTELDFPAFTLCNFNKYRQSTLTNHDLKNVGYHLGEFSNQTVFKSVTAY